MVEHSPAERRALIAEDETLFAMSLSVDMQALGFANCDLAATGQDAFLKAMEDLPDIVLMDVNIEGGRRDRGCQMASRGMRHTCCLRHCIHRPRHRRSHSRTGAGRTGDRKDTLSRASC